MNSNLRLFFCLLFLCLFSAFGLMELEAWGRKEKDESSKAVANENKTKENEEAGVIVINTGRLGADTTGEEETGIVEAAGVVRLVGTGLFPQLVITGTDREWYITKEEESLLWDLQNLKVIVEGEETTQQLKFANGLPAGVMRTLKNIKIITVEQE